MDKILKTLGWTTGLAFITVLVLGFMAATGTGFAIVNDGNRGIMKTGTEYDMTAVKPGYHFFVPIYQTMDIKTVRPILVNYSVSEGNKEDFRLEGIEIRHGAGREPGSCHGRCKTDRRGGTSHDTGFLRDSCQTGPYRNAGR